MILDKLTNEGRKMKKEDLILLQEKVTKLRAEGKYKETIEYCYELIENAKGLKD